MPFDFGSSIQGLAALLCADQEQLEKAREIIKRLKEEKKQLAEEMRQKMQSTEQAMEEEKEKLVQELSRGKAAAIALMQVHGFGLSADVSLLWVGLSRGKVATITLMQVGGWSLSAGELEMGCPMARPLPLTW